MSTTTFLSPEELEALTGRMSKKRQIDALRMMRVPFWVGARWCPGLRLMQRPARQ